MQNYNNENKEKNFFSRSNRKDLIGITFLIIVLLSIFITSWMVFNWLKDDQCCLPLSKIEVTGKRQYTRDDDIRQSILTLNYQGTFITQDVNIIQKQIKRIPWIKQVNVKKQWPDELKIHLVEYIPIAHWNDHYMLDMDGNSFILPSTYKNLQNLPNLYGPEDTKKEVLKGFCEMKKLIAKNKLTIQDAEMTSRYSWKLTLTNGIKLNLGRDDRLKRLSRFVELYPILEQKEELPNGKRITYVDLRYDSGAAVSWELIPSSIIGT